MKILYGVPGEGMGHATRSKVVIDFLRKEGHEVRIVSSGNAFKFLEKNFPGQVNEIRGFHIAYKDHAVSILNTFTETLKQGPERLKENFRQYRRIHEAFHPGLIISDFESFTFFFAKFHRLPIISFDNMQVIDRCNLGIGIPRSERDNYRLAKQIIKLKVPNCDNYFITAFFDAQTRKKNTQIVPPIIREEILQLKPSLNDHILLYQKVVPEKQMLRILQELPKEKFLLYGYNKEAVYGNVQLKAFSEQEFIENLASAKAVLANGGFSFLSEAVYLQKPVLSVPIANQFEQFVNAAYIDKLGYGRHFTTFTPDNLRSFLYDLPKFQENLSTYQQNGNQILLDHLKAKLAITP